MRTFRTSELVTAAHVSMEELATARQSESVALDFTIAGQPHRLKFHGGGAGDAVRALLGLPREKQQTFVAALAGFVPQLGDVAQMMGDDYKEDDKPDMVIVHEAPAEGLFSMAILIL